MTTEIKLFITRPNARQEGDVTVIPFYNVTMIGVGDSVDELQHDMDELFELFKPGSRILIRNSPKVETQQEFETKTTRIIGSSRFAFRKTEDGSSVILEHEKLSEEGPILYGFGSDAH